MKGLTGDGGLGSREVNEIEMLNVALLLKPTKTSMQTKYNYPN